MARLGSLVAYVALRFWPFRFGLGTIIRVVGLPAPRQALVTRRLRGLPLRLQFNPRSCQGRFLYYRGQYEERLIAKLGELLRPGMTFVDVGANIGLYSVIAAHLVGPAGRVLAFEPQASLEPVFLANVRMNDLANVTLERVALGSVSGTSDLFQVTDYDVQATLRLRPDEQSVGAAVRVPVRTLSEVLRAHGIAAVDGMKIDVEGGELDVLQGFADAFATAPPRFIVFECIDALLLRFGHTGAELIEFLRARDYTVYEPRRRGWAPVALDGSPLSKDMVAIRGGR
jgi:FkbM family methyltransferase